MLRCAVFSTKPYDRQFLDQANSESDGGHRFDYLDVPLNDRTASLAVDQDAVCAFVNDVLDAAVLETLAGQGVKVIAMRCAGFNNVDLAAAHRLDIPILRVPAYSPHAVAEHALALILGLNRHTHRAWSRVRDGNFELDGLLGFDLNGKTVGVVGTGRIGEVFCQIMQGLGCRVLAYDPYPNENCTAMGVQYRELDDLLRESDIISLHCPLSPETHHLIGAPQLRLVKHGVMIINTSRGALLNTRAMIDGLKTGRVGALGLDVYEEEADLFFENLSNKVISDDVFMRLTTFPNVLITGHQGFFTSEALANIAATTVGNLTAFDRGEALENRVIS